MRNFRISMKKQQPNICKLRQFLNTGLNKQEDELFGDGCYGRYYGENYINNSRTKSVYLSYHCGYLERISFQVKGNKPLIILSEDDYELEKDSLFFNPEDINYKIVSDYVNFEDYITDEMRSVMHESNCRHAAKYKKFKEFRKSFIMSTIEECLN